MDDPRSLGIARVALTLQVTVATEQIEALLRSDDRVLPETSGTGSGRYSILFSRG